MPQQDFFGTQTLTQAAPTYPTGDSSTDAGWESWPGGPGYVAADGTFDGATVKLERRSLSTPANGVSVGPDVELTADGQGRFEVGEGEQIRVTSSDGGASQSVKFRVLRNRDIADGGR